jgi:rubrerythrin
MTTVSFSPPDCAVDPGQLDGFLAGTGLDGRFMADLLSSCLMHEQCGLHLYRTAISTTDSAALKRKYQEFGAETEEHIRIFEELITACGGQPGCVSPTARLTEALDTKIHEAAIGLPDGADRAAFELAIQQTWEQLILSQAKAPGGAAASGR